MKRILRDCIQPEWGLSVHINHSPKKKSSAFRRSAQNTRETVQVCLGSGALGGSVKWPCFLSVKGEERKEPSVNIESRQHSILVTMETGMMEIWWPHCWMSSHDLPMYPQFCDKLLWELKVIQSTECIPMGPLAWRPGGEGLELLSWKPLAPCQYPANGPWF